MLHLRESAHFFFAMQQDSSGTDLVFSVSIMSASDCLDKALLLLNEATPMCEHEIVRQPYSVREEACLRLTIQQQPSA